MSRAAYIERGEVVMSRSKNNCMRALRRGPFASVLSELSRGDNADRSSHGMAA